MVEPILVGRAERVNVVITARPDGFRKPASVTVSGDFIPIVLRGGAFVKITARETIPGDMTTRCSCIGEGGAKRTDRIHHLPSCDGISELLPIEKVELIPSSSPTKGGD
jgi:hypothetical protein